MAGADRTVWETLLETDRLNYFAGERDQGAIALVLDLAKAFERVSLPVGRRSSILPGRFCVCYATISQPSGGCSSKDVWRSRSRPSRPVSLGQNGVACSCAIVLQDALSEVTKILPPLKLRVFVDDRTAFMNGRNKDLVEMAENVSKKLKSEVEEKRLKLSITQEGK